MPANCARAPQSICARAASAVCDGTWQPCRSVTALSYQSVDKPATRRAGTTSTRNGRSNRRRRQATPSHCSRQPWCLLWLMAATFAAGTDSPAQRVPGHTVVMRQSRFDAVVVGGGHNGLVAATYLARAGRSVLVLERLSHVGGATVSAATFAGVDARLSRYAYLVSLLPASIINDLGLRFQTRPRRIASYTPCGDSGLIVVGTAGADPARSAASFTTVTGGDSDWQAWQRFYAATGHLAQRLFPTMTQPLRSRAEMRALAGPDGAWDMLVERPRRDPGARIRQRHRARSRAHRRRRRHVRPRRGTEPAAEPLPALSRDRKRHRGLAGACRRHGRAHGGAARRRMRSGRRDPCRGRGRGHRPGRGDHRPRGRHRVRRRRGAHSF